MKIGIVGLGYWGPNLVRNFLSTETVTGVVCYDSNPRQLQKIKGRFPMVECVGDLSELITRDDIVGVGICTPPSSHYALGKRVLEAGKHLLVEKPLALCSSEAEDLLNLARSRRLTLMVDHTFVYTAAVKKMKELIQAGELGEALYFDSVRVNLGLFQHDTNVLWDLAPHDLSIMSYLLEKKVVAVSAAAINHFNGFEDMAYLTVFFEHNLIAHFHVNWLSPVKIRRILLGGTNHMIVYDDMEPSEKIKVYDRGIDIQGAEAVHKALIQYRTGDMYAPKLESTEALSLLAADFVRCIQTGDRPITDGESGLLITRILEAANLSVKKQGVRIELAV